MRRGLLLWLVPTLAIAAATPVTETGSTLRAADLKAKPFLDADTLVKLPEHTEIQILTRQGAWMRVRTKDNKIGYIRLLQVRLNASDAMLAATRAPSARTVAVATPLPGGTAATATTGVRGFSEEDLKASQPNKAEYDKMKSLAATPEQAIALAANEGLVARVLPYYGEDGTPLKDQGGKK